MAKTYLEKVVVFTRRTLVLCVMFFMLLELFVSTSLMISDTDTFTG